MVHLRIWGGFKKSNEVPGNALLPNRSIRLTSGIQNSSVKLGKRIAVSLGWAPLNNIII